MNLQKVVPLMLREYFSDGEHHIFFETGRTKPKVDLTAPMIFGLG